MQSAVFMERQPKVRWQPVNGGMVDVTLCLNERETVLENEGEFAYLYANGFLSVHVHGINLELPFILNKKPVFLLGGVDETHTCHQVVQKLWQLFQSKDD